MIGRAPQALEVAAWPGGCGMDVHKGSEGAADGDGFEFDLRARRVYVTDEAILAGLRRYARKVGGRRFGTKEWDAWRGKPCGVATVVARYGSWRAALAKVGVEDGRARSYSAEELVANLEAVWKKLRRPPGTVAMGRLGKCSAGPYLRHWGSVREACEAVAAYHAGEISREELLRGRSPEEKKRARTGVPVGVRWRVLKRDGYRCVVCGRSPAKEPWVELHVDHVVAAARGGGDEESNLRTLCSACNLGKGGE